MSLLLIIKCSRCKSKVLKYHKIGQGRVLRCYQDRITKIYGIFEEQKLKCPGCKNIIGVDKDGFLKMTKDAFTYTGKKVRT